MDNNNQIKYVLIIGGSGCLGKALSKIFKSGNSNWKVHVIDYIENDEADKCIVLNQNEKFLSETMIKTIYQGIDKIKYESIINVSGAYEGGSIKNIEIFDQSEKMLQANYYTSLLGKFLV